MKLEMVVGVAARNWDPQEEEIESLGYIYPEEMTVLKEQPYSLEVIINSNTESKNKLPRIKKFCSISRIRTLTVCLTTASRTYHHTTWTIGSSIGAKPCTGRSVRS